MFSQKIDPTGATQVPVPADLFDLAPVEPGVAEHETTSQPERAARIGAAIIIASLPFMALWLLLRLAWRDIKAIGRGIAFLYRAIAEELSRQARLRGTELN